MRSRESDVPHGIFKGLGRGVASRGARHADARISLPPGARVQGAQWAGLPGRAEQGTASLALLAVRSPLHLGLGAGGESGVQGHPSLLRLIEGTPKPAFFAEACMRPWLQPRTQKVTCKKKVVALICFSRQP